MRIQELMKTVRFDDVKNTLKESDFKLKELKEYEKTFNVLRNIKPTFDYFNMIINVKRLNGHVMVTNTHLGSISDLAGRTVKIRKEDHFTSAEAAAHIIYQITAHGYDTVRYKDNLEEWDDDMMTDYDEE